MSLSQYLSPEPMLRSPHYVSTMAKSGMSVPTYAYAANNPLKYTDRDGRRYSASGQFGGYHVNYQDSARCSASGGNTCYRTQVHVSPSCMRETSGDACKPTGKWKFDVSVSYDTLINFQEGVDPSDTVGAGTSTVWGHENDHLSRIHSILDEGLGEGLLPTEGFATKAACETARRGAMAAMGGFLDGLNIQEDH